MEMCMEMKEIELVRYYTEDIDTQTPDHSHVSDTHVTLMYTDNMASALQLGEANVTLIQTLRMLILFLGDSVTDTCEADRPPPSPAMQQRCRLQDYFISTKKIFTIDSISAPINKQIKFSVCLTP